MLYAALTFWLLVIVFSAWGVHRIWSGLIKPRVVNMVLLPGTLVAQLGHVLGLLVTGNPVRNTQLIGDDEQGEPKADAPEKQRLPIIGPVVVGLLPLVACAACLAVVARMWGWSVVEGVAASGFPDLSQRLPTTLPAFWELLHACIRLMEVLLDGILHHELPRWSALAFLYLSVCLTIRMAPFEGNRRGTVGAILLAGLVIGLLGSAFPTLKTGLEGPCWLILSFTVGMLLFLLLLSLLVAGAVGLGRILIKEQ